MAFDLVIFDCDGVLVNSEPLVNRAFLECVARDGLWLDSNACLARFTGATMAARISAIEGEHHWKAPDSFVGDFHRRLSALVQRELEPVSGVPELLARIHTPICVASNGTVAEMRERLSRVALLERFAPHLFSATDRPRPKPFPDVYLHAAKQMGVSPRHCAVVEDSGPGVEAAKAAGMTVFGYATGERAADLERLGATTFSDMANLDALIER